MTLRRALLAPLALLILALTAAPALAAPGDLDPTYNDGQPLIGDYGSDETLADLVVQPDGKVVVLGRQSDGMDTYALLRYNADGSPDTSFGQGGIAPIEPSLDGGWSLQGLALQGSKILVGGSRFDPEPRGFGVMRFAASGALDTTFGDGGIALASTAQTNEIGMQVALDAQGRILLLGHQNFAGNDWASAVVRFGSEGDVDTSFGTAGTGIVPLGPTSFAGGMALDGQGRIVVVSDTGDDQADEDIVVARLLDDGSLDAGFGAGGYAVTDVNGSDWGSAVAVQADGRIVVAGNGDNTGDSQPFVLRFEADGGGLDGSFGDAGVTLFEFAGRGENHWQSADSVRLGADGRIFTINSGNGPLGIEVLTAGGDHSTFASVPIAGDDDQTQGRRLAWAPDGKLVAGGMTDVSDVSGEDIVTVRLLTGVDPGPTPPGPPAPPPGPPTRPAPSPDSAGPTLLTAGVPADRRCVRWSFNLRSRAIDRASGIRRISIQVDRRATHVAERNPRRAKRARVVRRIQVLRLAPGPHRIVVRATDGDGNVTRKVLRFRRCG